MNTNESKPQYRPVYLTVSASLVFALFTCVMLVDGIGHLRYYLAALYAWMSVLYLGIAFREWSKS